MKKSYPKECYRRKSEQYIGKSASGETFEMKKVNTEKKLAPPMFFMMFIEAEASLDLTPTEALVLMRLCEHSASSNRVTATHTAVARDLKMSRNTITTAFKSLSAKDMIAGKYGYYMINPNIGFRGSIEKLYESAEQEYRNLKRLSQPALKITNDKRTSDIDTPNCTTSLPF